MLPQYPPKNPSLPGVVEKPGKFKTFFGLGLEDGQIFEN